MLAAVPGDLALSSGSTHPPSVVGGDFVAFVPRDKHAVQSEGGGIESIGGAAGDLKHHANGSDNGVCWNLTEIVPHQSAVARVILSGAAEGPGFSAVVVIGSDLHQAGVGRRAKDDLVA